MPAQCWGAEEEIPEPAWLGLEEAASNTSPEEIGDHLRGGSDRRIQTGTNIMMVVVGMNRVRLSPVILRP